MCNCGCPSKAGAQAVKAEENKTYVCIQCNTFKTAPAKETPPECCGKRMSEMD
jgi:hypothetical protein